MISFTPSFVFPIFVGDRGEARVNDFPLEGRDNAVSTFLRLLAKYDKKMNALANDGPLLS